MLLIGVCYCELWSFIANFAENKNCYGDKYIEPII